MHRAGRKSTSQASTSRRNATGFAKRQASKAIHKKISSEDVYEYEPLKTRRAKMKLQYERDELLGAGPSTEVGDDADDGAARSGGHGSQLRLVGEENDIDEIGEDEDEEIDSDEAFGESDEERYAGFNFPPKKSKPNTKRKPHLSTSKSVRFAEVDLNEDSEDAASESDGEGKDSGEEGEEEGDPDEFIDVLDILDGRGEPESEGETEAAKPHSRNESSDPDSEGSAIAEDDGPSDGADHTQWMSEDDRESESNPSALETLESFITNLAPAPKRKVLDGEATSQVHSLDNRPRKRRLLREQTQVGTEGEFAAQPGHAKLSLDDLLAPISASSGLQSLKKSVKILASSSAKTQTLSAPLPQRSQEKLDREAAYEQTKEEIDKWGATMQRIREAEYLSFPLQAEAQGKVSNLELAAKFKPSTPLESAVDKLLKTAKMREQDIVQTEALQMSHLTVEEVAARRAELAKMRELVFRAEAKAKRVARIKSKTYRRIKKKEREKLARKLGDAGLDDEDDEETKLKREVERARERATLRHKNTGKWARAMKERGELDGDQRRDINEMLDRGAKLRRRIQGIGSDSEDSDDGTDSEDDEAGDAVARIKAHAFDELRQLENSDVGEPIASEKGKSVFNMKFMQDAMVRQRQRADQLADDLVRELGEQDADGNDADDSQFPTSSLPLGTTVQRSGGRVSYRPGQMAIQPRTLPSLSMASDTSSVTLKSTDLLPDASPMPLSPVVERAARDEVNPWLTLSADGPQKAAQKRQEVAFSKDSVGAVKSKHKLRKRVEKLDEEKAKARKDATVELNMSDVMALAKDRPSSVAPATTVGTDEDSDDHSETEAQEQSLIKGKGREMRAKAFEQRDLVARAFAGDNVVREFAAEKRREIEADAPKEVDMTLPGWGSWGGAGLKKAPPKPFLIKKIAGVDPRARADYGKAHVIVSEKRDKKAAKYLVKDLPYPYTSKAQFERSMDTPLGAEWNTRVGFQRGTLPKVVKKMGTVITPLERHF